MTAGVPAPTVALHLHKGTPGGRGEIIDVSGTLHQTLTIVLKENGFVHTTAAVAAQGITGISRSTGATYEAPGMGLTNSTFHPREAGDTFVLTFLDLTHLVRTGPGGDDTLWGGRFIHHLPVTRSGQFIEHAFDFTDCVEL